jgi:hypothetical protein
LSDTGGSEAADGRPPAKNQILNSFRYIFRKWYYLRFKFFTLSLNSHGIWPSLFF